MAGTWQVIVRGSDTVTDRAGDLVVVRVGDAPLRMFESHMFMSRMFSSRMFTGDTGPTYGGTIVVRHSDVYECIAELDVFTPIAASDGADLVVAQGVYQ